MKAVRSTLLIAAVTLGGCASSGSGTDSSQQVSWWNPLSYHWSSALPWNWFGASLRQQIRALVALTRQPP